ncbi:nuclear protein MDM1-like isoform X2 [Corticium candelabrum]|uniref:nuclear protein MDM1-like isoform X2 n=1 Tax=Corticium candelabrum TaxID=121492 RepID=UPI002E252AEE|nr:nuclear protein MDM1-like isoform X2 [Corticium candelabrum]
MPLRLKHENDRSREHEEQLVTKSDDARVVRVREPDFTRKRRVRQRTRSDGGDKETGVRRGEEEARRANEERRGRSRDARRPVQPTWPASEYQLQYHWKEPAPTESPLLVADHMLFGKTRNISGATQTDIIPRQSEYKSQFIDHQSQPPRLPSRPPAVNAADGPTVTTPTHAKQTEDLSPCDEDQERREVGREQRHSQPQLGREVVQVGREPGQEVLVRQEMRNVKQKREHEMPHSLDLHRKRQRRVKSTYKSSYKSPTKFLYWKGAYVSPKKRVQARDEDSLESWFAQVLELRQLAQRYQQRSRGTHFSHNYFMKMESNEDVATSDSKSDDSSISLPPRHPQSVNAQRVPNVALERPPERQGPRKASSRYAVDGDVQEASNAQKTSDADRQLFVRRPPPIPYDQNGTDDSDIEIEDMESNGDKEQDVQRKTYHKDTPALRVTQLQRRPVTSHQSPDSQTRQMRRTRLVGGSATHSNNQPVHPRHRQTRMQHVPQISSNDVVRTQLEMPQSRDPLIGQSSVNMGPRHSFQSHTVPIVKKHAARDIEAAQGMMPPSPEKDPLIGHMGGFGPRHMFQSQHIPIVKPGEEWGDLDRTPPDFKTRRVPNTRENRQKLKGSTHAPHDKPRCTCGAEEINQDIDDISDTSSVLSESQSVASETLERARKRQNYWA